MDDSPQREQDAAPSRRDGAGNHRLLAAALLLACAGGIGYALLRQPEPAQARPQPASPAVQAATMPRDIVSARRRPAPDDLGSVVGAGQPAPRMHEVIDGLHKAGIHSGLGAFNPPGTSPPLVGLVVPEDYPLPEGYVRHYQATDDGQAIEPILMYSPDYDFLDANGQPVVIPADRVVPPSDAPAGLPIRQVRIPPPQEPGFAS